MVWVSAATGARNMWIPYGTVAAPTSGVDFVPVASTYAPYRASTDRPMYTYAISSITASGFTGEGKP